MIAKLAILAVKTVDGKSIIALSDDRETLPIREAALAAQSAGAVEIDGKSTPIIGGVIIHTWSNPSIVWRFRCEPKAAKPKK
jgi:hypothetical protein